MIGCLCKALSSDIATAVQAEVKEANRGMVDSSRSTAASLKAMQKDVGRMVAAMEKSAAKCRCTVFAFARDWGVAICSDSRCNGLFVTSQFFATPTDPLCVEDTVCIYIYMHPWHVFSNCTQRNWFPITSIAARHIAM